MHYKNGILLTITLLLKSLDRNQIARTRRPSDEEIERICMWCLYDKDTVPKLKKQRVALAFLLAVETAMRAGELCSLNWDDIDFDGLVAYLELTKNGYSRDVPLSKKALKLFYQLKSVNLTYILILIPIH